MVIKVYVSEHCGPCKEISDAIKAGNVDEQVELVDVETDAGFAEFAREILQKGDGAVPSAYKDGETCQIRIVEDTGKIKFECPKAAPSASPQV